MRKLLFLAVLLVSVSVFARPIPDDDLPGYTKAVTLLLEKKPLTCRTLAGPYDTGLNNMDLESALRDVFSGELARISHQQSLLTFKAQYPNGQVLELKFTIAADDAIGSLSVERNRCVEKLVNIGGLVTEPPRIVKQTFCKTEFAWTCQPK